MLLTERQNQFIKTKNFQVEDTFTNLKNNYFQPVIEEEKKLIEEHEKSFLGKMGCGGLFSYGCLLPIVLLVVALCIPVVCNNDIGLSFSWAIAITLFEYIVIVWFNNISFEGEHKLKTPYHIRVTRDLLLPLTAIISQDQKDDSKISLTTNLIGLKSSQNKLSTNELIERNITQKRGLSVYESNVFELSALMADGAKISYNFHQIVNEVYIYKKRGSKHKEKGKQTFKAVYVIPSRLYKPLPDGESMIGGFPASINSSEKNQKITIKLVQETTDFYPDVVKGTFLDMTAAVYSVLEAN